MIAAREQRRPRGGESEVRVRRIIGMILIGTGVFGLVISVLGMVTVGLGARAAGATVEGRLAALDRALETTDEGLAVAGSSLADARTSLASLSTTIGGATSSISDTLPVLDNINSLTSNNLPESLRSTQAALGSAQQTARVIDNVLGTISSFGLLSSANYNPEVPLNVTIGQVAASLDTLPTSLDEIASGVGQTRTNLERLNSDLAAVASGLGEMRANLAQAEGVVRQYRQIVGDLRVQVAAIRTAATTWLITAAMWVGLLLLWLALAQVALFAQGFSMLRRG